MARLRSGPRRTELTAESENAQRTRRHSTRSSVPVQSIEEDDIAPVRNSRPRSTAPTKSQDKTSSNKGRVTRSNKGNTPLAALPADGSRKRRSDIGAVRKRPSKRQRSSSNEPAEEEAPLQSDQEVEEEVDDKNTSLPRELFDTINENLGVIDVKNKLPKLRPGTSVENAVEDDSRAVAHVDHSDEAGAEKTIVAASGEQDESQGSVGNSAETEAEQEQQQLEPIQSEVPQSAQRLSQPDASQREPLRPKRRKGKRQSKKAAYVEPNNDARDPSPEHGPEVSQVNPTPPTESRNTQFEKSVYDHPGSDEERPSQIVLGKGSQKASASPVGDSQKTKRGRKRSSQSSRQRDDVAMPQQEKQRQLEKGQEEEQSEEQSEGESQRDFDSSDDEPEVDLEFDASHPAEDSLVIDAPPDGSQTEDSIPTTRLKRAYVQKLMYAMTLAGWLKRRQWAGDILEQAEAAKSDDRVLSRRILAQLFDMYNLCKGIPRSLKLDQLEYLREHATRFSTLISNLRQSIDLFITNINANMRGTSAGHVSIGFRSVTKLHRRIIPMLVLTLDTTFEAGCEALLEGEKASQQTGEFTVHLLEPLERAAGWAYRLSQVVNGWYELHPPRREHDKETKAKENRVMFHVAAIVFQERLEKAMRDLDKPKVPPEVFMQRDEAIRQEREAEKERRREGQDRQMQRFLDSIKNIKPTEPRLRMRPSQQSLLAPSRTSHTTPAATQQSEAELYYQKHGWHLWEDDQLLGLIRTTSDPNYENFRQVLPSRSAGEMRERSRYLKLVMRNKYERRGVRPPGWCMEES
ncbi:uncharacterized protein FIESC28_06670 [Fusarium coffeatum]|uniref:Uncharacterized protein n=1 Tax=Fusarium coffeatum TaxID=231269 RepID=A0A366RKZ3_9HYPO|nr:uncharacterized protein FIESC28_06670 [Fusarium coffeatum]RBR17168.1 hypothetical protein FIESC28_06670 [Fusarium coffeatum]